MSAKYRLFNQLYILLVMIILVRCAPDHKNVHIDTIKVRVATEPDRLNPLLTNNTVSLQINNYIFFPLADFDSETLELLPLLVKLIPKEERVPSGAYKGDYSYTIEIKDDAKWSDGKPVIALDYLNTIKMALNPYVDAAGWRSYLKEIKEVQLYPDHPKKFTVVVEDEYMLSKEVAMTFQVLPAHIYDSNEVLSNYTIEQLRLMNPASQEDTSLKELGKLFNSDVYSRDIVVGSGPYQLKNWATKQAITIERTPTWWGKKYEETSYHFESHPRIIEFVVIADEMVALTALKDGQIQVMSNPSADQYIALKKNTDLSDRLRFMKQPLMRYVFISLNNKHPILDDKSVRQALVRSLNTDQIINDVAKGLAQPVIGPFYPSKSYYNRNLSPIRQDLNMAKTLLNNAGWKDSNNNGIVDQTVDGQLKELELDIYITTKETGRKIALLFQENAKKIGIDINLVVKEFKNIRADLKTGDYEMAILIGSSQPTPDDPYSTWHTDNIGNGGNNYSGFGNARSDKLIETIRTTTDLKKRDEAYLKLQKIIYDEQPFIFLFAPLELIIADKNLSFKTSPLRPGYFINTFKQTS